SFVGAGGFDLLGLVQVDPDRPPVERAARGVEHVPMRELAGLRKILERETEEGAAIGFDLDLDEVELVRLDGEWREIDAAAEVRIEAHDLCAGGTFRDGVRRAFLDHEWRAAARRWDGDGEG